MHLGFKINSAFQQRVFYPKSKLLLALHLLLILHLLLLTEKSFCLKNLKTKLNLNLNLNINQFKFMHFYLAKIFIWFSSGLVKLRLSEVTKLSSGLLKLLITAIFVHFFLFIHMFIMFLIFPIFFLFFALIFLVQSHAQLLVLNGLQFLTSRTVRIQFYSHQRLFRTLQNLVHILI